MRSSKKQIVTVHEEKADFVDDFDMYNIFEAEEINTQKLKLALKQLNVEEKALLYLKYMDNRSIRDIAKIFMLTESAVKMRLMRSREKLRKKYQESILFG
jgi:RNA polymerase sigma-70 factor (ECF subfamily)